MATPTHLSHKPIVSIDDYAQFDGIYANNTDVESLSIGYSQYEPDEISAKVFRRPHGQWSRQSEELPLHRVIDLTTFLLQSVLSSAGTPQPITKLNLSVIDANNLGDILNYYKNNRNILLPKLQELQKLINYFNNIEPSL